MSRTDALRQFTRELALTVIAPTVMLTAAWYIYDTYYGTAPQRKAMNKRMQYLRDRGHDLPELNEYELTIAAEIIQPEDIDVSFSSIGGLDNTIASLRESLIYPLVYPHLFPSSSALYAAPKGVLLHGPPGCGKTLLAKALAKESNATFINIAASVLTSKWYGETNKLVAAMFSLARKVQPSILFLDEIDSFLRERTKGDHEASSMMKAEFMTLWDGLTSSTDRIVVLGATNRVDDIDAAFLRRMPKRYLVSLPDARQRASILKLLLADVPLEEGFQLEKLAEATPTLSGSDLKELCRTAAHRGLRDSMSQLHAARVGAAIDIPQPLPEQLTMRPLTFADFVEAMKEYIRARSGGVDPFASENDQSIRGIGADDDGASILD